MSLTGTCTQANEMPWCIDIELLCMIYQHIITDLIYNDTEWNKRTIYQ